MKKQIIAISTVVLLGTGGTALAGNPKEDICHNGSTYNSETMEYDPISFSIRIAGRQVAKAVDKHLENHGDSDDFMETGEGEECELLDDGETVECAVVTLCEANS
jgi:hypothetical protein